MTRINIIAPEDLTDSWLLAEFREIMRLPDTYEKSLKAKKSTIAPKHFKLGQGHVVFFHDKGQWLADRYNALYDELVSRGYNATKFDIPFNIIPSRPYQPSLNECLRNIERFREKFDSGQKHKIRKKAVDPKLYLDFLTQKYYTPTINATKTTKETAYASLLVQM